MYKIVDCACVGSVFPASNFIYTTLRYAFERQESYYWIKSHAWKSDKSRIYCCVLEY